MHSRQQNTGTPIKGLFGLFMRASLLEWSYKLWIPCLRQAYNFKQKYKLALLTCHSFDQRPRTLRFNGILASTTQSTSADCFLAFVRLFACSLIRCICEKWHDRHFATRTIAAQTPSKPRHSIFASKMQPRTEQVDGLLRVAPRTRHGMEKVDR